MSLTTPLVSSIVYILEIYKQHEKTTDEQKKDIENYQTVLITIIILVIIGGFLFYLSKSKSLSPIKT
jgi:hypothetical protein